MIHKIFRVINNKFGIIKEEKKLMNMNHQLASKRNLIRVGVGFWIVFFLLFNFIINFFMNMGDLFSFGSEYKKNIALRLFFNFFELDFRNIDLYIFVIMIDTLFTLICVYKLYISNRDFNIGQKGNERFSTLEEIQKEYKSVAIKNEIVPGTGGIPVSYHDGRFYIDDGPVNNVVLSMTRGGKDQVIALPMCDIYARAEIKSSLLISDIKLDMYAKYHDVFEKQGFITLCLNLIDFLKSIQFNPLQEVINYYDAGFEEKGQELALSIGYSIYQPDKQTGNERYFAQASMDLLAAFIIAITTDCINSNQKEKINLYSIFVLFSELYNSSFVDNNGEYHDFVREYFVTRPASDQAKLKFLTSEVASSRSRGNVYSTFLSRLSVFSYTSVAKMTSGNDINLEDIGFGDKPYAIFLGLPDYDKSKNIIASLFIRQVYFVNARRATREKGQRMRREIVHILNEFGNMPAIEDMSTMWTVGLSRGFKYTLFIHSFQQMKELYKDAANIILDNVGNLIYLLASSDETVKKISEMLGNRTITNIARNGEKFKLDKSFTETNDGQPLIPAAELRRFKDGENVVIRTTKRKDLEGKPIKKYPIHNCEETQFPYWFEYQPELAVERTIDEFNMPDLADIDLEEKTLDIQTVIRWISERIDEAECNIRKKEIERKIKNIEGRKLSDGANWKIIEQCLKKYQINEFTGESTVIEFAEFLRQCGETIFDERDYELLKAMLDRQI